ncbi:placenta-specific gene 8 protein-like isoform X2 [Phasianus colchicus]|nr:placenta-specific gene 8 protein-like isoform X2 [Phasianus colchicus]
MGDGGWVWGRKEDGGKKQAALELLREDTPSVLPHQPSFQDTLCKDLTMATRHVVTIQPGFSASPQPSKWHTGLLDCMSDCSVCICGAFCYPCLGCQVANAMDEFCLCGGSVAMRTLYRTRYNIPGSILGDYYSVLCCPMCSLCQLKRDIDYRKEQRTF